MPTYFNSLYGRTMGRNLPSDPTQAGKGAYGAVPSVPSPTSTQGDVIGGNLQNLGALYGLTGSLNQQIAKQAVLPYQQNLPNYSAMVGQSSGNILSQLKGQVPQDVANQIAQMAAERGVSTGAIGSPNANAALLRSLGLTSLGLQQQGEQNLTGAIGRTPTGQQFNPASFLVTPGQQQEAQWLSNLMGAAPNPAAAAHEALKAGQQGLRTGLGTGGPVGGFGGGGGGFGLDPLGFSNYQTPEPGMFAGGALGAPQANTENAGEWNQWNASMPWNQQGNYANNQFGGWPDLEELYGSSGLGADLAANVGGYSDLE